MPGPQSGLAVVEAAHLVERHQDVVIEVARIVVRSRPVAVDEVADAPRARIEEVLARHRGEGRNHAFVAEMGGHAQILGEPSAHVFQRGLSARPGQSFRTCIWIGPSARPWMNWSTWALFDWSISEVGPCQISLPS